MGNKVRVVIVDSDQGESKDSSKRVFCVCSRGLNGCSAIQFISNFSAPKMRGMSSANCALHTAVGRPPGVISYDSIA